MIKILVMDVDGTLTDGKIYIGNHGEVFKAFSVKDGAGIKILHDKNIKTAIVTGRNSEIVNNRAKELSITYVQQGVIDKEAALRALSEKIKIPLCEFAYIGDDINDLKAMRIVKYSFAPSDSVQEVLDNVSVILKHQGGDGAVRECVKYILEINNIDNISN